MRGFATQSTGFETQTLVVQRWALILATVPVVVALAPTWPWVGSMTLTLLLGAATLHLFDRDRLELWLERGYLWFTDAMIVGLTLLGLSRFRFEPLAVFSLVALLSLLLADRRRSLLGSVAMLGLTAALGTVGALKLSAADVLYVPLMIAAAIHFGQLGQVLAQRAPEARPEQRDGAELYALLEITDTITGTLEVGEVMHSVVEQVGDLAHTPHCSILLVDGGSPGCFVVASKGHPEADMLELDLQKYPEVRHVLDSRRPLLIDDVTSHPLVAPVREKLLARGTRSILVLPLLVGRETVGALLLKSPREKAFPPPVVRFCKVVAGVSANALKNAMLYRDVKQAGDKLRQVLDASPDMIVATDADGRISEFNPGAERLTGVHAADVVGQSLEEFQGAERLQETLAEIGPLDATLTGADGAEVEVSLVSAPLSPDEQRPAGRVWIGRDVTKLRQVEKSLAQAERLSSLGEVVAGVAHELNNPLSGVVGYAELLRAHATDPGQIRDLQRIVESAMRCQKIVFKLLSFARKHAPEKKYQDLNECVEKVLDLKSYHLRSSQIRTELDLCPDLPQTCFDFHQIDQVILNMLNNAEQAIRSVQREGTITLRTGRQEAFVYVEVADDGPGVPVDVQERVFDPFFTTKDIGQGTGLGLSVSYGIVQEHGGRIELMDSDKGARFRVYLPVVEGRPASEIPVEIKLETGERPLEGRRILVAEDEPMVLELIARLLTEEGAEVTQARDGLEAWAHLEGDEQAYDLVVTDLRMPNLNGRELFEKVIEARPEMMRRFVFATGDLAGDDSVAFLEGLPNRILTKPLELETVRRVLSQAIDATIS